MRTWVEVAKNSLAIYSTLRDWARLSSDVLAGPPKAHAALKLLMKFGADGTCRPGLIRAGLGSCFARLHVCLAGRCNVSAFSPQIIWPPCSLSLPSWCHTLIPFNFAAAQWSTWSQRKALYVSANSHHAALLASAAASRRAVESGRTSPADLSVLLCVIPAPILPDGAQHKLLAPMFQTHAC